MFGPGLRLTTALTMAGVEIAIDAGRAVLGDDLIHISPRQFRRLLLTFEDAIQGRIPEILGDDEKERVETLVRLLRGTSEKDLTILIGDLQTALNRLYLEEQRDARRAARRLRALEDRLETSAAARSLIWGEPE